ncbi:Protein dopey-1 [Bagarius yarrelli]|uniref:Protein dopey-1 n=1 Tax=Bagarius yarrelli TaxID=175774 RepID=A0A556U6F4_BAGYA|nr:Protein dopey-1 [Bagarius yarrelli]
MLQRSTAGNEMELTVARGEEVVKEPGWLVMAVLQNNAKYQVVPRKLTIGKRLAQCLHPALPSGVHRKALETYEIIFKIIGSKRLAKDLFLYSSGLFPLLSNASMSVKPVLLGLYEMFYLPLGKTLKPGLQGFLTGVLPGLEEGSDYHDRTNALLEKVASAVEQSVFYSALWGSILTSGSVRLPAISFVLLHLNRKLSMEDQLYIIGSDIELMSHTSLFILRLPANRGGEWANGFDNNGVKTGPKNSRLSPAILEDVLIEVFRTLHTQCRAELDLQNQSPFSKDQTQLSRKTQSGSSAPHLSLFEFCQLVDFLLDIVSLAASSSPDVPVSEDVFEDRESSSPVRSFESSFTDFVQYEGEESENHAPPRSRVPDGSAAASKAQGAPVMQRCLEHFQNFLCRLVELYIAPCHTVGRDNPEEAESADGLRVFDQKECVSAFTAACQLFLECSSFPVYVAEGNLKSSNREDDEDSGSVTPPPPPRWLESLMNACFSELDFSVRAVAVSLLMDLVGLTQSVAMVTAERVGVADSSQPMSPNQGRVAVVIRPPLTQGMLKHIADNTDFFKSVAVLLWDHLGESTPQHHQRSVELFYQLHNLVPSSSICEDVISNQLMHRDKKIRLEAHVKFSVLWHLTRDLNITKSSPFSRTFDRSLFIMLDSLSFWDGSVSAVGRAWLNQVLQRHDIARVLEPILLMLLHPKTHRVSIQRVQAQRHWTCTFPDPLATGPGPEPQADVYLGDTGCSNHYCLSQQNQKILPLDDMEPFSLTVNPLSDSLSLLSLSIENLQLCGEYQPPDQQGEHLSSESTGSQSSTVDNGSLSELEGSGSAVNTCDQTTEEAELEDNTIVSVILEELLDRVVQMVEDSLVGTPSPPEVWTRTDSDSSNTSEGSIEAQVNMDLFLDNQNRTLPELVAGGTLEFLTVPSLGDAPCEGITRHSSSPSIVTLPDSIGNGTPELSLRPDDPQSRKRSHSSTQLSLKGKIMERFTDISPGAKPKVKKNKKKEEVRRKSNQVDKNRPPSIFFGDSLDLENWYSCGEGEVSEIESDIGSPSGSAGGVPGSSRSSTCLNRFNIHPLYQHVLLYLQIYDSSRTLHAISAIAAMLRTAPAGFVSAISTTSINNTYTPQLSLLQNLLARHRVSVMGKDFYCPIPQDSHSHSFRSAMYLEIIISLCLYFLRSYYSSHVPAAPQDLAGNRTMQLASVEVLTLLFSELAKVTGGSAKGFASFISDVLSKCKVQKVALHCLLSSIFSAQKWHEQRTRGTNLHAVEEGLSEDSIINLSEDQLDGCSGLQSQLLRLIQSLIVLEHHVLVPGEESGEAGPGTGNPGSVAGAGAGCGGFEILGGEVEHVNPQQPMASLQYLHGQPITAQGMFLCAVIRALHQHHACKMHPQWISLVTATLPYMGRVLRRVVASVTLQLCRNLDNLIQQYRYETGITDIRPQWMALCIPPDLILTVLEGVTAIIHYCLLDPSSQYHQLQVSVDQKHLAEARSGILSILHTIMSSVTLLWSALYLADCSERPSGASCNSNINLGSTKNLRQQILELLGPISMNHGAHFMAAIAYVWNERKQNKTPARNKVIPTASDEQLLLVDLVRSVNAMRTETVMQTVKEVLKQPPAIAKEKDVTHKIVEAIGTIAGSSLEQTTWLRRNLEVKPSPQIVVDGAGLETDVEDLMLTVMEASSFTPSVYSVHALTLLAEVLAHLLDMVFYSDEKERVIPLLVNIMHYVVPYLRNHSAHNAPSYRACIQLLSSLSGYQYTRRAWKKEAFDLFMDHTFFQMDASCVTYWRAIIDHLMTHDKTTFRDLMSTDPARSGLPVLSSSAAANVSSTSHLTVAHHDH